MKALVKSLKIFGGLCVASIAILTIFSIFSYLLGLIATLLKSSIFCPIALIATAFGIIFYYCYKGEYND